MHKFSNGKFQGWLVGKMAWEVRFEGNVLRTVSNMAECWKWVNFYHSHPELV